MSYQFDGANDFFSGSFSSTYSEPLTFGIFFKVTTFPPADTLMAVGVNSDSNNESYAFQCPTSPENTYRQLVTDSVGASSAAGVVLNVNNIWTPAVSRIVTDEASTDPPSRSFWLANTSNTDVSENQRLIGPIQHIRLAENLSAGQDYTGLLAEIAVWNTALSLADVAAYMGGQKASTISPGNLIGYWPLDTENSTQANEGLDSGGDLTAGGGASFNADHPIIFTAGVPSMFVVRPNIQYF